MKVRSETSGVAADAGRNPRLSRRKTLLAPVAPRSPHGGLLRSSSSDPSPLASRSAATDAPSEPAKSVALLNVQFLNDHEDLEPTTSAERARLALIASLFKAKLEASGRYQFVSIPADAAGKNRRRSRGRRLRRLRVRLRQRARRRYRRVDRGPESVGSHPQHQRLHGRRRGQKMAFVHSVDIRGNTDESWTRGVTYLVKNYLLPGP